MITVPSLKILKKLPRTPTDGEQALVEDEKKIYQYQNSEWKQLDMKNSVTENVYAINATAISQLPAHSKKEIKKDYKIISNFKNKENSKCYLLLCKDYGEAFYVSVFLKDSKNEEPLEYAVIDCLQSVGTIHEITNEVDHLEFWVKDKEKCMYCFLFFPYDLYMEVC